MPTDSSRIFTADFLLIYVHSPLKIVLHANFHVKTILQISSSENLVTLFTGWQDKIEEEKAIEQDHGNYFRARSPANCSCYM
jgi:hypothetical protein